MQFKDYLSKILAIDKQAHFFAGATIASTVTLYSGNAILGVGCAVAMGILKELYDLTGRGTPDVWDAVVTTVGALVVIPHVYL